MLREFFATFCLVGPDGCRLFCPKQSFQIFDLKHDTPVYPTYGEKGASKSSVVGRPELDRSTQCQAKTASQQPPDS